MSRKYYIDAKEVGIYQWREAFAQNIGASVYLQTHAPMPTSKPPIMPTDIISPEKVRELQKLFREKGQILNQIQK